MRRALAWLPIGFTVAGLGLLVAAAALYVRQREQPDVTIDEPVREGLTPTAGTTEILEFRIHNPRREAIRIVGLAQC